MIITESKPYGIIRSQLKKSDKIGIVSCNSCARMCGTGGKKGMEMLAKKLKKEGFNVVDADLIGRPCNYDELKMKREELHGDTTIVLSCDAGIYLLKKLFPGRKIILGLDAVGIGTYDNEGNITLVRKLE